ncbi:hypothetical protein Taro_043686, partial [Colocasia esculenta]|nr:hypothetical protein [Colocasia esculenta]
MTKYDAIKKFKGMSGVDWNDDAKMITMDEDTFNEYIAAHPKDEPYINKSIDMYEEFVVICGDDQATRSFSRTVADSVADVDSTSVDVVNEETSETPPPPWSVEDHSTSSEQVKRGRKRRRDLDSKIDMLANKIGDLTSAISRSRNRDISFELYEEARSFLARDDALRLIWLEDFFGVAGPSVQRNVVEGISVGKVVACPQFIRSNVLFILGKRVMYYLGSQMMIDIP